MKVVFNPTGTHIHNGLLKVRFDVYPDLSCLTYKRCYVSVPVIGDNIYKGKVDASGSAINFADYQKWLDSLPHVWQLNPMLNVLLTVREMVDIIEIQDFFEKRFTPADLKTLDRNLVLTQSTERVSVFMKDDRLKLSDQKVATKDIAGLIALINQKFAIPPIEKISATPGVIIAPGTITVGTSAEAYTDGFLLSYYTMVDGVACSGDGTITSVKTNFQIASQNLEFALFTASGNSLTTIDSEAVGVVASGVQTTTGITLAAIAGCYIGENDVGGTGKTYAKSSGGSGYWFYVGDGIPGTNTYTLGAGRYLCLYGTGTEAGGVFTTYYRLGANV